MKTLGQLNRRHSFIHGLEFKKYENLYDKVLYCFLPRGYEIQIRSTGCDFAIELTDGYKCLKVAYVNGYTDLKNTIKEFKAIGYNRIKRA